MLRGRGATLPLLCAALLLTACRGPVPEPAAAAPVTLEFWYQPDGPHPGEAIAEEVARFEAAHPGVRVHATQVPWEQALTKMTTAVASGQAPDVMQVGSTWVAGLAAQGAFRPVTDSEVVALGGHDAFVSSAWRSTVPVGSTTPVAVPWLLDTRVVFYRTDVLRAAGVDPRGAFADWASFERTLARLQQHLGERPLGFPGVSDWNVVHNAMPWVGGAGGRVLDEQGRAASDVRTIDGIYELQRIVGDHGRLDVLEGTDDDAKRGFARGDYPVVVSGPYFAPVLADEGTAPVVRSHWSSAELPAGPAGRVGFLGGSDLAVSAQTAHAEQALQWVAALTSPESQRRVSTSGGLLPAVRAAVAPAGARTASFAQALEHGTQYPAVPRWIDIETQLQHDLSDLWREVLRTRGPLPRADVAARVSASLREVQELTAP